MARKLEFDRELVLQKAMRLFWEKGYASTSMEDLVNTMGINRFSIYNSFGDKKALFIAALGYYQQCIFNELLKPLDSELSGLSCLENYLDNLGQQLLKPSGKLGCLIQRTGQSSVIGDQQVAELLMQIFDHLQRALMKQVRRAMKNGELKGRYPAEQVVDFILASSQGLIILRRIRENALFVSQQVDLIKQTLRTW